MDYKLRENYYEEKSVHVTFFTVKEDVRLEPNKRIQSGCNTPSIPVVLLGGTKKKGKGVKGCVLRETMQEKVTYVHPITAEATRQNTKATFSMVQLFGEGALSF